jgi:GT2 family glycosyltransferase
MTNIKYNICVVTVTYSNRWSFLKQVIQGVISHPQVSNIIVVDNASGYNIENEILAFADVRITLLKQSENTGSAMGYQTGIKYAHTQTNADFILLLDDDNVVEGNAINTLLASWHNIEGPNISKALFGLRTDRKQHIKIAQGENPNRYYLIPNNFMGFHFLRIFKNQYNKLLDKFQFQNAFKSVVKMPYVPYGGLFMHRDMVQKIGYPDEQFYLYVDDSEYTYRITKNGANIWLIPEAKINDVDKSQGIGYQKKLFHSQLLDLWSFRTYYHIRNRLYFYSKHTIHNKFIFKLNKVLFLLNLRINSLLSDKKVAYHKLKQAVDDGLNGRLGKADPNKF